MDVEPDLLARVQLLPDHFKSFPLQSSDSSQLSSRLFCIFQGAIIPVHFFAKVHDVYIRCQLARDQQQPDTLQMLGAIESRLLVKFHVVGWLGRVGTRWSW